MKNKFCFTTLALLALLIFGIPLSSLAQGTAFTYQGRLGDGAAAANGNYDLRFTIYDLATNGSVIAGPLTNASTLVTNGLFTLALDFGAGVFTGPDRWLEIGARTNGAVSFATLAPRQKISATPYAVTAGGLSGTVPFSQLPAGILTNSENGVALSGTLSGNGAGLTNVNAATLGGLNLNNFWRIAGNAGTAPGPNYIGTSDNQPLEIRVNATRALRIEPHGFFPPSLVGGYDQNTVAGYMGAVVAGGGVSPSANTASGDFAFIGAGYGNVAGPNSATVAGEFNTTPGIDSFIGSGALNTNGGDESFIGGGQYNSIGTNSIFSTMGGGFNNSIQANSQEATIAGGHDSIIQSAAFTFIGGGGIHMIQSNAYDSVIVGGGYNTIQTNANGAVIGGGYHHTIGIGSTAATIDGGYNNTIGPASLGALIGSGYYNTIGSNCSDSIILGGYNNLIQSNAYENVIVGGHDSVIQPAASYAFIGAGGYQQIQSNAYDSAIVAGGYNTIQPNANGSFIGGGYNHTIQTNASASVIGGGSYNTIQSDAVNSAIGGGYANTIQTNSVYSFIGGGYLNVIQFNDYYSTIGGGGANTIQTNDFYSTIAGGVNNTIQANAYGSTIGGGNANTIQSNAPYGTIPGGYLNIVAGPYGFAAGQQAQAMHQGSFVWADFQNAAFASTISNQFNVRAQGGVRFVTGGAGVTVDGQPALIAGNGISIQQNTNGAPNVIEGASNNFVSPGVVGATISGGGLISYLGVSYLSNSVTDNFATVGGGLGNTAGFAATVAGGEFNSATNGASVGGGLSNAVNGTYGTIGGGGYNSAGGLAATVGGGAQNTASAQTSTVGGGGINSASAEGATVSGGYLNTNQGIYAAVGGGSQNFASGKNSTVSGGLSNQATNLYATVPGGVANLAGGIGSFAAGQQARALHQGSFVWADFQNASFSSTTSNQFNVRAGNGLRISDGINGNIVAQVLAGAGTGYQTLNFNGYYDQATSTEQRFNTAKSRWRLAVDQRSAVDTLSIDNLTGTTIITPLTILTNGNIGVGVANPTNKLQVAGDVSISGNLTVATNILSFGSQGRQMMNLWGTQYGIGIQSYTLYFRTDNAAPGGGFAWFQGGVHSDLKTNAGGGVVLMTLDSGGLRVNGTFVSASDRNLKQDFGDVNSGTILEKVSQLPIQTWAYKNDPTTKHLGPVAQDFYAAFGIGPDETHITTVDEGGVALAAIQGLNRKLEDGSRRSEDRIQMLQQTVDQKETEITELKLRLAKLEELMNTKMGGAQ